MPLLFGHATCFVFHSLLEAGGNALMEALACGMPILCSQRRPMTDLRGDAVVTFNGEDPPDIADRIYEVLSDASLRGKLSRRAVARVGQFSWRQGAEKVHRVFEQLPALPHAGNHETENILPEGRT